MTLEEMKQVLEEAIADIPHVGRYCAFIDERRYCKLTGQICCRQVNTACPDWKWRGERCLTDE